MTSDEPHLAAILSEKGLLKSSAPMSEWERPHDVKVFCNTGTLPSLRFAGRWDQRPAMFGPELRFKQYRHGHPKQKDSIIVKPPVNLLELFLNLGDASDKRICDFAEKYGGLKAFCLLTRVEGEGRLVEWTEYCDIWRYFSRAMRCILRITASIYNKETPSPRDWSSIGDVPIVIRDWIDHSKAQVQVPRLIRDWDDYTSVAAEKYLHPTGDRYGEPTWQFVTGFIAVGYGRHQNGLVMLMNALLTLGRVAAQLQWASGSRPQVVYTSRSLLSNLALQLCLRAANINDFAVCSGCQKQYVPLKRAPKTGQRSFCGECRNLGIPKRYGNRDWLARKRLQDSEA